MVTVVKPIMLITDCILLVVLSAMLIPVPSRGLAVVSSAAARRLRKSRLCPAVGFSPRNNGGHRPAVMLFRHHFEW